MMSQQKKISENPETFSTGKQVKRHKARKREINSPSSSPDRNTVQRWNKKRRSQGQGEKNRKDHLTHHYLLYPVHDPAPLLNQKKK